MLHEVLGEIATHADGSGGIAMISYGHRRLEIEIDRDDQPFGVTLTLSAAVVMRLPDLDRIARKVAVAGLREIYNNGWNEYDEVQDDGTLKRIANPHLSGPDFEKQLSLESVWVVGDRVIHFFYDDEGMFWGHKILVTSLNGLDLNEAYAELVG